MDFKLLCLTFVLATSKSASQILTVTPPCIEADKSVTLRCKTNDFSSSVIFRLDGDSKGGCSGGTCLTGVDGYTPTQSGSYTEMAITAYNQSRDGGNWTCEYGGIPSDAYTVELGDCSSGGGSTGLSWWEIFLIVVAVIALIIIAFIIFCCILNSKCKFGDVCKDSKLSFTFPPGNESKVKITPASNLGYKEGTPNKEAIINYNLNNGKSSIAASPPRSGANQPLYPLIKGEGGNGNGEDLPK